MRGYTLIEVLVVIVLVSLLGASAVMGLGAVKRGRLRAGAAHVASAFRFAYVHALTTGRATRVAFTLGGNQMWVEDTDDAHVLDTQDPLRTGGAADDLEAAARDQARRLLDARPRAPRANFARPRGRRFEPRRVERDVVIARLYTAHEADAREEDTGYVYFFSGGVGERAVVHLRGAGGETFSIVLHPLTGRSRILDHPVEPPTLDDRDTTDQTEIDTREREAQLQ